MKTTTAELAATTGTNRAIHAQTILQRAVCLTLECHYLGNKRKIDLEEFVEENGGELKADEEQFNATKRLIPTKELSPVKRQFSRAKRLLRTLAISTSNVFGERSYLIPNGLVEQAEAGLTAIQSEMIEEARKLAFERYLPAVERQRVALGKQFKESDYITPEKVFAKFVLDWDYVSFAAPDKLEQINHVLAARANQKHADKLAKAYDETLLGLRASALEVVSELEERLTPGPGGKPKSLRGTALRDLEEFIKYLPHRNMTGDDKLATVMARISARADGMDVDMLNSDASLRAALTATVAGAKEALKDLVETGRRSISFGGPLG